MTEPRIEAVRLNLIDRNPKQPRQTFDERELNELAKSLRSARGQRSPIQLRRLPNGRFQIVAGERRWRASCINRELYKGPSTIKAIIEDLTDAEMAVDAIVENRIRADVNPVEEAAAFKRAIDDHGFSVEELAGQVGIEPWRVRERLALTDLDDQLQVLVKAGQLAPTCGVEISKLPKPLQVGIAKKIGAGSLSTIAEIRAAVTSLLDRHAQGDLTGAAMPRASKSDMATMDAIERRVASVKAMVASGFKDGEIVVAKKVNPTRARAMAEELEACRLSISRMVTQLKQAAVQHEMRA